MAEKNLIMTLTNQELYKSNLMLSQIQGKNGEMLLPMSSTISCTFPGCKERAMYKCSWQENLGGCSKKGRWNFCGQLLCEEHCTLIRETDEFEMVTEVICNNCQPIRIEKSMTT